MTDYGQFYEDEREERRLKAKKEKLKKEQEFNRKFVAMITEKERCSAENTSVVEIVQYAKKLNELRKEAASKGVCLDELEAVAKELK